MNYYCVITFMSWPNHIHAYKLWFKPCTIIGHLANWPVVKAVHVYVLSLCTNEYVYTHGYGFKENHTHKDAYV